MGHGARNLAALAAFAAGVAAMPLLLTNDYYLSTLILAFLNAMVVIGLNLLLGYAGQISLGHGAFYGLAAYTTAVLTATCGWPVGAGCAAGVALTAAVAYAISIPTLKLSGHSLAMATLGFGLIVYIVFNEAIELTGGPSGFVGIPRLTLFGHAFESDLEYYYLTGAVLTLLAWAALNLIDSRVGRAMRAIHTSERAAEVSGIDITGAKRFIFVLSAAYAGVAGVLYAHYLGFVAPSSFGFHFSVTLIVMVVLGGMASVWGAVAGAVFLTALPEFLRAFEDVETLLYGAILVLCVIFVPQGLAGAAARLARLLIARRPHVR
ncbi:branched-chain amino acid ABC transporter permease [Desulfocurvus vexinensis]|uniref:branched-chain amino acid ABC transporter permease n=1 Tax=Desulfocurvus vexinensis TaxID=399548 RepID=UPI00048F4C0A|nr:branched-chain amino acid ABC transporter permease [Desulfocurvus vexinensis]